MKMSSARPAFYDGGNMMISPSAAQQQTQCAISYRVFRILSDVGDGFEYSEIYQRLDDLSWERIYDAFDFFKPSADIRSSCPRHRGDYVEE